MVICIYYIIVQSYLIILYWLNFAWEKFAVIIILCQLTDILLNYVVKHAYSLMVVVRLIN